MSAAAPPPANFRSGPADTGRACPYCRSSLEADVDVVRCGACESVHHAECWATNRGCAIVACAGGPTGEPASTPAPAPPVQAANGRRVVIDVGPERRQYSWLAIAILILVAVLVIAGAAIVFAAAVPVTMTSAFAALQEVPLC